MRRFALICLAAAIRAAPASAADQPPALPFGALNRALTETVAVPAYRALVPAMETLALATEDFCLDPPTGVFKRLVDGFHGAMTAWQHAQPINFGPVAKNGRAERFEFWPDTGASTDRQIRRAMSERDPAMVADDGLAGKSIALQNLATYERLLAENASRLVAAAEIKDRNGGPTKDQGTEEDRYACAWMAQIARFQERLARDVAADWATGFAETLITAEAGNTYYADARAAATDYLKSLAFAVDNIVRQKLERPMDVSVAKARPARAESWRTKRSLDNIVANLETAQTMFTAPGGFADLLTAAGSPKLADDIRAQFDAALKSAHGIGKPLEDAMADAAYRPKVDELLRNMKALRSSITGPLAADTGLVIGFNSLDGD